MKILLVEVETHFPFLGYLKSELHLQFRKEIVVHKKLEMMPAAYFNAKKGKWDADKILWHLREKLKDDASAKFMTLALFPYDMYNGPLGFVYGLSEQNGNFAVVSYFRLDPKNLGRGLDDKKLIERLIKEATHEIGHMHNLEHCKSKKCVMSYSPNIFFVDKKNKDFCERCKKLI
jgi:archaemetzincin